tara:strand:+ start:133 stop:333 length:201 start_codon:yes stop_codon:yes gene_type:complete
MAAYGRFIRLGKQALREDNKEAIEDLKKRFSHVPGLWEQVLKELEAEKKPAKKAPVKKVKKAKKDD